MSKSHSAIKSRTERQRRRAIRAKHVCSVARPFPPRAALTCGRRPRAIAADWPYDQWPRHGHRCCRNIVKSESGTKSSQRSPSRSLFQNLVALS
jgi:hypothetical protein